MPLRDGSVAIIKSRWLLENRVIIPDLPETGFSDGLLGIQPDSRFGIAVFRVFVPIAVNPFEIVHDAFRGFTQEKGRLKT